MVIVPGDGPDGQEARWKYRMRALEKRRGAPGTHHHIANMHKAVLERMAAWRRCDWRTRGLVLHLHAKRGPQRIFIGYRWPWRLTKNNAQIMKTEGDPRKHVGLGEWPVPQRPRRNGSEPNE